MKKYLFPVIIGLILPLSFSCGTRLGGYILTQADAAAAIRQMLSLGSGDNTSAAFSKERILSTIFPGDISRVMGVLNLLGFNKEIDRFTTTLGIAAAKTAASSVPILLGSIKQLTFSDAIKIVSNGGTAATDYLREKTGTSLRQAITPIMQNSLEEYKLNDEWDKLVSPVRSIVGDKINIDLSSIMATLVTEVMYNKIAQKEVQVRTETAARSTALLQKVFSKAWN